MDSERILTAEQIRGLARLLWGDRFETGADGLADFLGINQRNANRLLAGEMRANAGISAELVAELRSWLSRSADPMAALFREVMEPHMV